MQWLGAWCCAAAAFGGGDGGGGGGGSAALLVVLGGKELSFVLSQFIRLRLLTPIPFALRLLLLLNQFWCPCVHGLDHVADVCSPIVRVDVEDDLCTVWLCVIGGISSEFW
jgi:hypothetical protein